jgi:hypothetical protein
MGDILLALDGTPTYKEEDVVGFLRHATPGSVAAVRVLRLLTLSVPGRRCGLRGRRVHTDPYPRRPWAPSASSFTPKISRSTPITTALLRISHFFMESSVASARLPATR